MHLARGIFRSHHHSGSPQHVPEEIDRFFGCLEDLGDSPPTPVATPETTNPFCRSFFSAIEDDGNELPPFVLPADVGTEVESPSTENSSLYSGPGLGVVLEEEEPEEVMDVDAEDEFVGEEDEGGIRFTFKIPPGFASPESSEIPLPTTPVLTSLEQKSLPFYEPAIEDIDDAPFPFSLTSPASRTRASPPSPSAIARATALKRFEGLPMLCSHRQHAELECHHCYNRYWWCRWRWCWQLSGARDGSDDNEACLISHEAVLDLNHCSRVVQ